MNIIFRKLDITDQEDIRQFNELMDDLTTHAHDTALMIEKIQKINLCETSFLMVAEDVDNHKICASLLAIAFDDFCESCRPLLLIENVVTHHDYQHKGIGKMMFEEIEAWGRERNVNYIILCSGQNRVGAHKFYEAIGYEEIKGFKKYL